MNSAALISLIKDPDKLQEMELLTIQEVVKQYSFFQSAQLLLAKKYQLSGSTEFDKQLKIAAIYAGERKVLYHLIHSQPQNKQEEILLVEESRQAPQEALVLETIEIPADDSGKENQVVPAKPVITEQKEEPTPPPTAIPPSPAAIQPGEKHSFSEWLTLLQRKGTTQQSTAAKEPSTIAQTISSPPPQSPKVETPPVPINVEDLARQSLREDDNPISSTLADIYANQGKYEKAIRLYEKLSLQYPDKSAKFAGKIKELKSKL